MPEVLIGPFGAGRWTKPCGGAVCFILSLRRVFVSFCASVFCFFVCPFVCLCLCPGISVLPSLWCGSVSWGTCVLTLYLVILSCLCAVCVCVCACVSLFLFSWSFWLSGFPCLSLAQAVPSSLLLAVVNGSRDKPLALFAASDVSRSRRRRLGHSPNRGHRNLCRLMHDATRRLATMTHSLWS